MRRLLFLSAGCMLASLALIGCRPDPVAAVATPGQLMLYSIDGRDYEPGQEPQADEKFHGYPVLGKVEIAESDRRREIFAALQDGMAKSDGRMANCFWPRHAIRTLENGRTMDYVICFQCDQLELHVGDTKSVKPITRDPQPLFNKCLKEAGVPLAPGMADE